MGWAVSLLTFPGGPACHGRSNQLVGENVMSLLTGGELTKCCLWGEEYDWFRNQYAGEKPRGTRGAIPLSSQFDAGDPK